MTAEIISPIVQWAVSDKSATNAWHDLVLLCANTSGYSGAYELLSNLEAEYKTLTGATSLPGKYRSAKSTILGALLDDVGLLDGEGFPMPKTALGKETRSKRAVFELTMEAQIDTIIDKLLKLQSHLSSKHDPDLVYKTIGERIKNAGYI